MLCFGFDLLRLVNPMLPVSLDCSFLIAPSVFSNVYKVDIIVISSRVSCSRHDIDEKLFIWR